MIKQVPSYQTSDNQLHADRGSALTHEAVLDVRGIIQSNHLGKISNMTVTDVAQFIINHGPEIHVLLGKYKEQMRRIAKK